MWLSKKKGKMYTCPMYECKQASKQLHIWFDFSPNDKLQPSYYIISLIIHIVWVLSVLC